MSTTTTTRSSNFLFRVPQSLRKANPEVYEPRVFHFGPYTSNFFAPDIDTNAETLTISVGSDSSIKETMVTDLVGKVAFESLVSKIVEDPLFNDIQDMYPDLPRSIVDTIPTVKLARLFAISAVIIVGSAIHFLLAYVIKVGRHDHDSVPDEFIPPIMRHSDVYRQYAIEDATVILENQIPIFLLKLACQTFLNDRACRLPVRLHEISVKYFPSDTKLLAWVLWYCLLSVSGFDSDLASCCEPYVDRITSWIEDHHCKPIMACIYDFRTGRIADGNDGATDRQRGNIYDRLDGRMMSASKLRRYGVTFVCDENASEGFTGIKYEEISKTLTLPMLKLYDTTVPFLCNLMAYEVTLGTEFGAVRDEQHVGSYVTFLDFLIDTDEDVEVLVAAGVLQNFLERSNASVAQTWDGVVRWLQFSFTPEYAHIVKQLRDACKGRWQRWWASFKETYWEKKPWLVISILVATALLFMSALQTYYAARQTMYAAQSRN